jgi:hypothetical protein
VFLNSIYLHLLPLTLFSKLINFYVVSELVLILNYFVFQRVELGLLIKLKDYFSVLFVLLKHFFEGLFVLRKHRYHSVVETFVVVVKSTSAYLFVKASCGLDQCLVAGSHTGGQTV